MAEFLKWLNANNGAVMALLTTVYVIATVLIFVAMARANAIAHRGMQQLRELEAQKLRRYLLFKFAYEKAKASDGFLVYAYLKNAGKTQAIKARIKIDPLPYSTPIMDGKPVNKIPGLLTKEIGFIAPGEVFTDCIGFTGEFFERFNPAIFRGAVSYSDLNGKNYSEPFVLDLEYHRDAVPMEQAENA